MIDVICNLCGRDDYEVVFPATMTVDDLKVDSFSCTNPGYGHHAQVVKCKQCGYMYANPRWSGDDILDAYTAVEDETYVEERIGRELTFSKHLQAMEKYTGLGNGRSLLDVGAYIGVFVDVAKQKGWDAWGVEPSEWAADVAQKNGLNVIHGTQDAAELADKTFDVVTMWDVIEHVPDPSAEMAKAFNLLKPGGWIVLHTMDIDSVMAKVMGERWPWLMDMHIHYFSQKTMADMLQKNGFKVVWSGAQGRYLRLNYLVSRVGAMNQYMGHLTKKVVGGLNLGGVAVPINFRDLFTVYAQRPKDS